MKLVKTQLYKFNLASVTAICCHKTEAKYGLKPESGGNNPGRALKLAELNSRVHFCLKEMAEEWKEK